MDTGRSAGLTWCAPTHPRLPAAGLTTEDIAKRDTDEGVEPQFQDGARAGSTPANASQSWNRMIVRTPAGSICPTSLSGSQSGGN
jgi:hypothetical protein